MSSPKFKVGDWVCWTSGTGNITAKITAVNCEKYEYELYNNGIQYNKHPGYEHEYLEERTRLLTKLERVLK